MSLIIENASDARGKDQINAMKNAKCEDFSNSSQTNCLFTNQNAAYLPKDTMFMREFLNIFLNAVLGNNPKECTLISFVSLKLQAIK